MQAVISNLNISKIIYKDEFDVDVKKYLNEKTLIEVQIGEGDIVK